MNTRPLDPHADAFCRVIAEIIIENSQRAPTPPKPHAKKRAPRVRK